MDNLTRLLKMTDEDLEKWDTLSVIIPLPLFESLVNAMNLLAEGKRLTKKQRDSWENTRKESQEILDGVYKDNFNL